MLPVFLWNQTKTLIESMVFGLASRKATSQDLEGAYSRRKDLLGTWASRPPQMRMKTDKE
jgi:hypothetical protein